MCVPIKCVAKGWTICHGRVYSPANPRSNNVALPKCRPPPPPPPSAPPALPPMPFMMGARSVIDRFCELLFMPVNTNPLRPTISSGSGRRAHACRSAMVNSIYRELALSCVELTLYGFRGAQKLIRMGQINSCELKSAVYVRYSQPRTRSNSAGTQSSLATWQVCLSGPKSVESFHTLTCIVCIEREMQHT